MTTQIDRLSGAMLSNYMSSLTNRFYKILPIKESEQDTLHDYVSSLLLEMTGCKELIIALHDDDRYLSLLSILQYIKEHDPDVKIVRREVFKSLSIIKKLQKKYCEVKS